MPASQPFAPTRLHTRSIAVSRLLHLCVAAAVSLLLLALLRAQPPWLLRAIPACPVRQHLHLLCPGCGSAHALLALLGGRLRPAWQANPLFLLLLPCLLGWTALAARRYLSGRDHPWPAPPPPVLAVLVLLTAAFGILRNL